MANDRLKTCECALCGNDKQFTVPEHLIEQIAKGNVIVFAGAGISTEAKDKAQHTFYEAIAHELGINGLSFPSLMSRYCSQPDGRIKVLSALKRIKRKRKSGYYHDLDRLHSLIHSYMAATTEFRRKRDYWNAEYANGYLNALIFLHESNEYDNMPFPPLYRNTVTDAFASLSSITKYPRKRLPKSVLQQFAKMPIIDVVTGETMIPDHMPYLDFPARSK